MRYVIFSAMCCRSRQLFLALLTVSIVLIYLYSFHSDKKSTVSKYYIHKTQGLSAYLPYGSPKLFNPNIQDETLSADYQDIVSPEADEFANNDGENRILAAEDTPALDTHQGKAVLAKAFEKSASSRHPGDDGDDDDATDLTETEVESVVDAQEADESHVRVFQDGPKLDSSRDVPIFPYNYPYTMEGIDCRKIFEGDKDEQLKAINYT